MNSWLALATTIAVARAFSVSGTSLLDSDHVYKVDTVEQPPSDFSIKATSTRKQSVLASSNSSSTTLPWQSGMSFIDSDSNNESYTVNVTIGDSEYPLLIDTGSAYLWIYDSNCTDSSCSGKQLYPISSGTNSSSSFSLAYSSGSASGKVVTDTLQLGSLSADEFEFGAASSVPDLFEDYSFSGVLGLPAVNSSNGLTNLVTFLKNQETISQGTFALCLGSYDTALDGSNNGLLVLGKDIQELYDGSIHYSSVVENTNNYWQVVVDSVSADSYQISFDEAEIDGQDSQTKRLAVVDSGTTSIVAASADATKIHSFFSDSITDGDNFAILCNSTLTLNFKIAGSSWSLGPDDYLGNAYGSGKYDGYCVSNIVGSSSLDNGTWILGSLFLRNYYVSFDLDQSRLGLADRNSVEIVASMSSASPTQSTVSASSTASTGSASSASTLSTKTSSVSTSKATSASSSVSAASLSSASSATVSNLAGKLQLASPLLLLSLLSLI
ncbi:hypothetical protein OGAPHI_006696 [Ogataea philodendri]|uniref:Peptidase A1 domain-containing protein n=1 Tax=Ogataea philodendri TaxID=1378263 RepID=A0A9P8NYB4_9ASCO|nr:uncharacterized protein OGAPHI_006696 [Ogataea philodendri]KAH3661289.1 hypothetical protein OGAPHI_006696 [Ogataea philodendri]